MIIVDVNKRISAKEVLKDEWIKSRTEIKLDKNLKLQALLKLSSFNVILKRLIKNSNNLLQFS